MQEFLEALAGPSLSLSPSPAGSDHHCCSLPTRAALAGSHIHDDLSSAGDALPAAHPGPFYWAFDVVQALLELATVPMLRSSLLMTGQSVSTSFSEVGTVEQAVKVINATASHHLGHATSLRFASACESDCAKQTLLRRCLGDDSESSPPCLFPDMLAASAIGGDLAKLVQSKTSVDFNQAWKRVRAAGMTEREPCLTHAGASCSRPRTEIEVSGPPCQPWSKVGKCAGRSSHLMWLVLVWIAQLRAARPLLVVHENVHGFDIQVLTEMLSDLYDVVCLKVAPHHVGFACAHRPRLYCVLYLRGKVRLLRPIEDAYQHVCAVMAARGSAACPHARDGSAACPHARDGSAACPHTREFLYVVATDADLLAEENRVRRQHGLDPLQSKSNDWSYLLTAQQRRWLVIYAEMWRTRLGTEPGDSIGCVFNLSQNPSKRASMSNERGQLPVCTRACYRLWLASRRRWLLPIELAAAHGFPVTEAFAACAKVPRDPNRSQYLPRQIGNAMHLANVGRVLAVSLACLARG